MVLFTILIASLLSSAASADCLSKEAYDLVNLEFIYNGESLNTNSSLVRTRRLSLASKGDEIIYFPSLSDSTKLLNYKYFEIIFLDENKKYCSRKSLAFNPLKLCFKDGVYEPWTFYRNLDDSLSVLGKHVSTSGKPYLKDSTVCGKTEINNLVSIENSFVKGWDTGEGKLLVEGSELPVIIRNNSSLEGFMTIKERVLIDKSVLKGRHLMTGNNSGNYGALYIFNSELLGKAELEGSLEITDSYLNCNLHFSGQNFKLADSTFMGEQTITSYGEGINIWQSTFNGNNTVSGENIYIFDSTFHGQARMETVDSNSRMSIEHSEFFEDPLIKVNNLKMQYVNVINSPTFSENVEVYKTRIEDDGVLGGDLGSMLNYSYSANYILLSGNNLKLHGKYSIERSLTNVDIMGANSGVLINYHENPIGPDVSIRGSVQITGEGNLSNGAWIEGLESPQNCYPEYTCLGLRIFSSVVTGQDTTLKGFGEVMGSNITNGATINLNRGNKPSTEIISGSKFYGISVSGFIMNGHVGTGFGTIPPVNRDLFGNISCTYSGCGDGY